MLYLKLKCCFPIGQKLLNKMTDPQLFFELTNCYLGTKCSFISRHLLCAIEIG